MNDSDTPFFLIASCYRFLYIEKKKGALDFVAL